MRAALSLIPPMNGGEPFTIFSVLSALERAGVTRGIDHKGLEKVIFQCLNDEKTISAFPAALGRLPKDSVPAHWQLKKRLLGDDETDLTSPKVDYRRKSPFILVKKGEGLARSIPAAPGEPGFNVRGDFLSGGENTVPNYFPGENIIEKNSILYAAVSDSFRAAAGKSIIRETDPGRLRGVLPGRSGGGRRPDRQGRGHGSRGQAPGSQIH